MDLQDGLKKLSDFIGELSNTGSVEIEWRGNNVIISPNDRCTVIIRYERMHAGRHLSLKMELLWDSDNIQKARPEYTDEIKIVKKLKEKHEEQLLVQ